MGKQDFNRLTIPHNCLSFLKKIYIKIFEQSTNNSFLEQVKTYLKSEGFSSRQCEDSIKILLKLLFSFKHSNKLINSKTQSQDKELNRILASVTLFPKVFFKNTAFCISFGSILNVIACHHLKNS